MRLLERLNAVLAYIEAHLCEEVDTREMAKLAACSIATLQRTFAIMLEMPLSEYIRRRRLTQAAYVLQNSGAKVIDVALNYGYDSPESFARAFKAMHGTSPSGARLVGAMLTAQPPITLLLTVKGATPMEYKIVQKEAFDVYGIERVFDTGNGENFKRIPQFWDEVLSSGQHEALAMSAHAAKSLLCPVNGMCTDSKDLSSGQISYMIFAFATEDADTSGYTKTRVPASTWAIFKSPTFTNMEETSTVVQALNKRVYQEWLPMAPFKQEEGFDMELYYDENGTYWNETWIRVKPV